MVNDTSMAPLDGHQNGGQGQSVGPPHPPPTWPPPGAQPDPSNLPPPNNLPAPGELGLAEKRSWKTWQLVVGMIFAAGVGLAINYHTVGASPSSSNTGGGDFALPTTTTTAPGGGADAGTSSTTTTTNSGSTTTTTSSSSSTSSSTTTPSTGTSPARLLVGPIQSQGDWTSPAFTITAPSWNIGWAFQCTPAPTAGSSFQISVVPSGTSPTGTPAVTETGASGQAVAMETSTGQQTLVVEAPANCAWAVKVTGS
jgi:hypothetical protein